MSTLSSLSFKPEWPSLAKDLSEKRSSKDADFKHAHHSKAWCFAYKRHFKHKVLLLTHIIKSNKNTIYAYFSNEYFLCLKIIIRCLRKDLLLNGVQIVGPYARLSHLVPQNLWFFWRISHFLYFLVGKTHSVRCSYKHFLI